MTCRTNFKPKVVKMHDTVFYCCDEMKYSDIAGRRYLGSGQWDNTYNICGEDEIEEIFFCPFCGYRLSNL